MNPSLPISGPLRPLPYWRAVLMVMEHFWTWYRRSWRASVVSSVVQPVLFLLAFGVGFGSLVGGQHPAALGGVPYLVYLAPGLLTMSAAQIAVFESTYPVLSGFKWQQTYWGMAASPLTPGQVAFGQLGWIVARVLSSGLAYLVALLLVGGARGPGIVVALAVAALVGAGLAALTMAYSASREDPSSFTALYRFLLIPMTLFAGTFYPVSQLPGWLHPVVWVTPLWHATELARGVTLDTLRWGPALGHLGYLVALLAVGTWLATRQFARRLGR